MDSVNLILQSIYEIKNSNIPLYFWGGGAIAERLTGFYRKHGIEVDGYLISKEYYKRGEKLLGREIECLEDFLDKSSSTINLVLAHCSMEINAFNHLNLHCVNKFYIMDCSSAFVLSEEPNILDEDYWEKNSGKILGIREKMGDSQSVKAFDSFIYQKRTSAYYKEMDNGKQYFEDFIPLGDEEVFLDCGAFDGDSVKQFMEYVKERKLHGYKQIIAIEPDDKNVRKIRNTLSENEKLKIVQKGLWDKKDTLYFSDGNDENSTISESGNICIEVDSIDNIMGGEEVTFIKMDIEGAELKALQGASNTIKKYRPKVAVCVYHRKEDMVEIPEFLLKMHPDYRFYFRNYCTYGNEAVLYAV